MTLLYEHDSSTHSASSNKDDLEAHVGFDGETEVYFMA